MWRKLPPARQVAALTYRRVGGCVGLGTSLAEPITTGSACHLDARLVHHALHHMPEWHDEDLFFIENVGNLVCPAIYDLGQAANVVVLAVTEGTDKPLKYPVMFRAADLVILSKIDLLPHLRVDVSEIEAALAQVNPRPQMLTLSAETGEGMDAWIAWLRARYAALPQVTDGQHHEHQHPS